MEFFGANNAYVFNAPIAFFPLKNVIGARKYVTKKATTTSYGSVSRSIWLLGYLWGWGGGKW